MADEPDQPDEPGTADVVEWVLLTDAAAGAGCTETWLLDRCADGRLPSRPAPDSGLLVPLATVQALVTGQISD
jgi:hypothetical protein